MEKSKNLSIAPDKEESKILNIITNINKEVLHQNYLKPVTSTQMDSSKMSTETIFLNHRKMYDQLTKTEKKFNYQKKMLIFLEIIRKQFMKNQLASVDINFAHEQTIKTSSLSIDKTNSNEANETKLRYLIEKELPPSKKTLFNESTNLNSLDDSQRKEQIEVFQKTRAAEITQLCQNIDHEILIVNNNKRIKNIKSFIQNYYELSEWNNEDKQKFIILFQKYNKDFTRISQEIKIKTTSQCVNFYYLHKKELESLIKSKFKQNNKVGKKSKSKSQTSSYLDMSSSISAPSQSAYLSPPVAEVSKKIEGNPKPALVSNTESLASISNFAITSQPIKDPPVESTPPPLQPLSKIPISTDERLNYQYHTPEVSNNTTEQNSSQSSYSLKEQEIAMILLSLKGSQFCNS